MRVESGGWKISGQLSVVVEALAAGFVIVGMVSRGEHMVVMERAKQSL